MTANEVLVEAYRDKLMGMPGVQGVGLTRDVNNYPALWVGVQTIADKGTMPSEIDGVALVVAVVGTFTVA